MKSSPLLFCILLTLTSSLAAQQRDSLAVSVAELAARLKYFSSDLFEGRAPGTRGETLTTAYLSSELASFGVQPAAGEAWLQPLSIVTHQPVPEPPVEARLSGRITRPLQHGRDIRLSNWGAVGEVATGGELVFVGYGIDAPIYGWNDFAGIDLRGKIAVALLGEPTIESDSVRFNGVRASRFARLADKVAEMERRGAVGVLFIRPAGSLAATPPSGQRRLAARVATAGVKFTGLLSDSAFASLLPPRAPALDALLAAARRPGFRASPLGARLDVRFTTRPVTITTHNVVGIIPGRDSALAREHVVLSAHWDAYGIGAPVKGDSIYNGALDDGAGVTALLALARVFAAHPQRRSITILFTAAEEWGLLGAEAFVCSGLVAPERIAANLNLDDGTELFGPEPRRRAARHRAQLARPYRRGRRQTEGAAGLARSLPVGRLLPPRRQPAVCPRRYSSAVHGARYPDREPARGLGGRARARVLGARLPPAQRRLRNGRRRHARLAAVRRVRTGRHHRRRQYARAAAVALGN